MRPLKIVSRGAGAVGRRGAPAPRASGGRSRVSVKVQAPRTFSLRRFAGAVDWGYCAFTLGWAVAVFVLTYVALGRMR